MIGLGCSGWFKINLRHKIYKKKETGNDSLKQPLTDLCHTLFNVKEFVFVN